MKWPIFGSTMMPFKYNVDLAAGAEQLNHAAKYRTLLTSLGVF
jgi:hypothetical protein